MVIKSMFITFKMEICSTIFEAYYYILHVLKTLQGLLPGTTRLLVLEKGEEEEEEKGEGAGGLLLHIVPCCMSWISYPQVLSNCGGEWFSWEGAWQQPIHKFPCRCLRINAQEFCAASNHLMMLHFHELSVCWCLLVRLDLHIVCFTGGWDVVCFNF